MTAVLNDTDLDKAEQSKAALVRGVTAYGWAEAEFTDSYSRHRRER
jgi:hypothetical protein